MIEAPDAYSTPASTVDASSVSVSEPAAAPPDLEQSQPQLSRASMTARQRMTLAAILLAGAVTLGGLLRLGKRLLLNDD
jgi:hypothetical protein